MELYDTLFLAFAVLNYAVPPESSKPAFRAPINYNHLF